MGQQWRNGEFNPTYGAAAGVADPPPRPWPTPDQQRGDLHWTTRIPRPVASDWPDYLLAGRQQEWDDAEAQRLRHAAAAGEMTAERERREQERQAANRAAFAAQQEAAAATRASELHANYLAAGGTAAGWESEKEAILAADRQQRTLAGASQPRSLIDIGAASR